MAMLLKVCNLVFQILFPVLEEKMMWCLPVGVCTRVCAVCASVFISLISFLTCVLAFQISVQVYC
jgi:hypothetical protein